MDANGRAPIHFDVQKVDRWSPENPKLYNVILRAGNDSIQDLIGFRTIEVRGTQILLNGKPVFLRGVAIHAEAPYRGGRAWSDKDAETLLGWARELGCNFVRLAHYPHDETMLRAADRMGLLVWSENPVYWALEFDNPHVLAKAEQQLDEEIGTLRNHASIILWSMANETPNTGLPFGCSPFPTPPGRPTPTQPALDFFIRHARTCSAVLSTPFLSRASLPLAARAGPRLHVAFDRRSNFRLQPVTGQQGPVLWSRPRQNSAVVPK